MSVGEQSLGVIMSLSNRCVPQGGGRRVGGSDAISTRWPLRQRGQRVMSTPVSLRVASTMVSL